MATLNEEIYSKKKGVAVTIRNVKTFRQIYLKGKRKMYNVKVTEYLHDKEVVFYHKPIYKHEKDLSSAIIENNGTLYEIDKKDLFLYEDRNTKEEKERNAEKDMLHSLIVSRNRTKQKIYNYARSNKWEWFLTFTFNPQKVDSMDYDEVTVIMSDWLNYMFHYNKTDRLKYLIVPEKHKSGAWHFHGVFSGIDYQTWKLMFSGKYKDGEPIYNVQSFPYGFTTATAVNNTRAVAHYICKYITKDLFDSLRNKKRYWVSRSCSSGKTTTLFLTKDELYILIDSLGGDPDYQKSVATPYNDILYMQFNN